MQDDKLEKILNTIHMDNIDEFSNIILKKVVISKKREEIKLVLSVNNIFSYNNKISY